jgi:hypothetical protein
LVQKLATLRGGSVEEVERALASLPLAHVTQNTITPLAEDQ